MDDVFRILSENGKKIDELLALVKGSCSSSIRPSTEPEVFVTPKTPIVADLCDEMDDSSLIVEVDVNGTLVVVEEAVVNGAHQLFDEMAETKEEIVFDADDQFVEVEFSSGVADKVFDEMPKLDFIVGEGVSGALNIAVDDISGASDVIEHDDCQFVENNMDAHNMFDEMPQGPFEMKGNVICVQWKPPWVIKDATEQLENHLRYCYLFGDVIVDDSALLDDTPWVSHLAVFERSDSQDATLRSITLRCVVPAEEKLVDACLETTARVFDPGGQLIDIVYILVARVIRHLLGLGVGSLTVADVFNEVAQEGAEVQNTAKVVDGSNSVTEVASRSCIWVLWPPTTCFCLGYFYACYTPTNAVHEFDPRGISSLFFDTAKCRFIMWHPRQITRRAESNLHIALPDVLLPAWIQLFGGLLFASTNVIKRQTYGFANDMLLVYGHGDPISELRTSSIDGIAGRLEIHLDTYPYFSKVQGSVELSKDALTLCFPLVCIYGAAVFLFKVEGTWGLQIASNERLWSIFSSVEIQQQQCIFTDETVKIFDPGGHGLVFAEIAFCMRDGKGAGSFCLGTKSGILRINVSQLQFYDTKEYG